MRRIAPAALPAVILAWLLAEAPGAGAAIPDVRRSYELGQYFTAARIAFNDANRSNTPAEKAMSYAWAAHSLVKAGLDQSALYFFIRTLQLRDRSATQKALELAPLFLERAGADFLKKFLIQYTRPEDYPADARNALDLAMARDRLIQGDDVGAVKAASQVAPSNALYPLALQIRGAAEVMQNQLPKALENFKLCEQKASQRDQVREVQSPEIAGKWIEFRQNASRDLGARCVADQARVLYELGSFEDADRRYDRIPKASFVWTDTLFEHAWNSYSRSEYNRALGKLVSYRSPSLRFVFNSEVEVLMAQSYLALCLYDDAARVIEGYNREFGGLAKEVKAFLDANPGDARVYFTLGRKALQERLHSENRMNRFLNRFVRSPYFQALSLSFDRVAAERTAIQRLDALHPETKTGPSAGFPGFLNAALDWRLRTIQLLGGVFVRNSMLDYYQILISDLEKMQFMKIDSLSHQKKRLLDPSGALALERSRGNRAPERRDDQTLWAFNGEFWNDEIGDYVFALESECGAAKEGVNAK
jgi:hypothetical protein